MNVHERKASLDHALYHSLDKGNGRVSLQIWFIQIANCVGYRPPNTATEVQVMSKYQPFCQHQHNGQHVVKGLAISTRSASTATDLDLMKKCINARPGPFKQTHSDIF